MLQTRNDHAANDAETTLVIGAIDDCVVGRMNRLERGMTALSDQGRERNALSHRTNAYDSAVMNQKKHSPRRLSVLFYTRDQISTEGTVPSTDDECGGRFRNRWP
jgi:hypothetical protein